MHARRPARTFRLVVIRNSACVCGGTNERYCKERSVASVIHRTSANSAHHLLGIHGYVSDEICPVIVRGLVMMITGWHVGHEMWQVHSYPPRSNRLANRHSRHQISLQSPDSCISFTSSQLPRAIQRYLGALVTHSSARTKSRKCESTSGSDQPSVARKSSSIPSSALPWALLGVMQA